MKKYVKLYEELGFKDRNQTLFRIGELKSVISSANIGSTFIEIKNNGYVTHLSMSPKSIANITFTYEISEQNSDADNLFYDLTGNNEFLFVYISEILLTIAYSNRGDSRYKYTGNFPISKRKIKNILDTLKDNNISNFIPI